MTTVTSHVGMIIHSTTLDTMAKVIAIYGGTTWVKIEGRFLLGQSSSYTINNTGGEATHTLTVNEMPSHTHIQNSHNHTQNAHSHSYTETYQYYSFDTGSNGAIERWLNRSGTTGSTTATNKAATATNQYTGGGGAHNNMPPYKVVYIWERTK